MTLRRDINIDIMRGICILCVVLGHSGFPFAHFVYLFHIPVLFMISGYLYEMVEKQYGYMDIVKKKIKRLWIPYVAVNAIYELLNNEFIHIHLYQQGKHNYYSAIELFMQIVKKVFGGNPTEMGSSTWFLRTLFVCIIAYAFLNYILKLNSLISKYYLIIQGVISFILLLIGAILQQYNHELHGFSNCFTCYSLVCLGSIIAQYRINREKIIFAMGMVSSVILVVMENMGSISLSENKYTSIPYLLIVSIAGWVSVNMIARVFCQWNFTRTVFMFLGQASMWIMILHTVCFKSINLLIICVKKIQITRLADYPTISMQGGWWILYTLVGCAIPALAFYVYRCVHLTYYKNNGKKE